MEKISVRDFTKMLRAEVEALGSKNNWNFNDEIQREYAFGLWLAQLFCKLEDFDTDPEEALFVEDNLGINLVLEDTNRKYLAIIKCKYASLGKKKSSVVDEEAVNFFNSHKLLLDKNWVKARSSEVSYQILGDYKDKLEDGYVIDYYYISTAEATDLSLDLADQYTEKFAEQALQIKCNLLAFSQLKEAYIRSSSIDEAGPSVVRILLPSDRFFQVKEVNGYPTVVAVIKGNALRDLYRQHRESLFAWNIRGYLGSNSINSEIMKTAKIQPQNFFYFNNGVSAICTDYELTDGNELIVTNFQIINGAQTVGTIGKANENTDIQVLLRLTKTASVKTEKGINSEIIRYNNSQNSIKVSDFRANDPIQSWLERKFSDLKPRGPLPLIRYAPKRQKESSGGSLKIKFEDLAKIRYAFLWEPTRIHSSPKELWTYRTEDGAYEKAFGVPTKDSEFWEIAESWTDEEFQMCLLGIAFFLKLEVTFKEEAKRRKKFKNLARLKYHALALIGIYVRSLDVTPLRQDLLANQKKFDELWSQFWPQSEFVLIDAYERAVEEEKSTLYALVRSAERWHQMKRRFRMYAKLSDDDDEP